MNEYTYFDAGELHRLASLILEGCGVGGDDAASAQASCYMPTCGESTPTALLIFPRISPTSKV